MKLVIAEKPSVAQSYAKVLGANKHGDGHLEGNGYIVSWCLGHLVELAEPEAYDENYSKWRYEDLPILPQKWKYEISPGTKKQFLTLKSLMNRNDVTEIIAGTDDGQCGGVTKIDLTRGFIIHMINAGRFIILDYIRQYLNEFLASILYFCDKIQKDKNK